MYKIIEIPENNFGEHYKTLQNVEAFAVDTEYTPLRARKSQISSIQLCIGETVYFIKLSRWNKEIDDLLKNKTTLKYFHNVKAELQCFWSNEYKEVNGIAFDSMIASYILDPTKKRYGLKQLVKEVFGYEMVDLKKWFKEGKTFNDYYFNKKADAIQYACDDAYYTYKLTKLWIPKIDAKFKELYYDIELPLAEILARMEMEGVHLNVEGLRALKDEYIPKEQNLREKLQKIARETL